MSELSGRPPTNVLTVLVMAGGTGGHVYPALAVAERLIQSGHRVVWLGTRQGLEAQVVPQAGIEIRFIRITGLRGKGIVGWLLAPARLSTALWQSLRAVKNCWPHAVLGMGGFAAGPGGMAAWLLGRPLLVHEQNAVPGLTNRVLGRLAVAVMEAFPGSFPVRYGAQHTGNPVRESILQLPDPGSRLKGRQGPLRLLVLGGSQGAQILNEMMPLALSALKDRGAVEVRHQVGAHDVDSTRQRYAAADIKVRLVPFIDDMAEAYAWADLVVCRAGAMTVSELAAVGLASILIPFPHAVDDHQTHNARYLSEAGAALLLPQKELSGSKLGRLITELSGAPDRLLAMAKKARRLALPDATVRVASLCQEVGCA